MQLRRPLMEQSGSSLLFTPAEQQLSMRIGQVPLLFTFNFTRNSNNHLLTNRNCLRSIAPVKDGYWDTRDKVTKRWPSDNLSDTNLFGGAMISTGGHFDLVCRRIHLFYAQIHSIRSCCYCRTPWYFVFSWLTYSNKDSLMTDPARLSLIPYPISRFALGLLNSALEVCTHSRTCSPGHYDCATNIIRTLLYPRCNNFLLLLRSIVTI